MFETSIFTVLNYHSGGFLLIKINL